MKIAAIRKLGITVLIRIIVIIVFNAQLLIATLWKATKGTLAISLEKQFISCLIRVVSKKLNVA
jgi:hypothetical protein